MSYFYLQGNGALKKKSYKPFETKWVIFLRFTIKGWIGPLY